MKRHERRHVQRLCAAWQVQAARATIAACIKGKRGYARQEARRSLERNIKCGVIAYSRWARRCGIDLKERAQRIGMIVSTLGRWERQWRTDRLESAPRGRPPRRASQETRAQIDDVLDRLGPGTGLPTLQGIFPDVPRRELLWLLYGYREAYREGTLVSVQALEWLKPNTVWAMDYTEPPTPVDGIYPYILAVRDLASGDLLMALPVREATAQTTCDALKSLFAAYGPPMVIKSDNDGAFTSAHVQRFLEQNKVEKLWSPPQYPCYNGSCEAGIGSLKTHAHHEAARNNRPGEWTCDDVEAARVIANRTARPKGHRGPTPEQMWQQRKNVTDRMREEFAARVAAEMDTMNGDLSGTDQRRIERKAVSRALEAHGLLQIRRRRISPHIFPRFRAKIT